MRSPSSCVTWKRMADNHPREGRSCLQAGVSVPPCVMTLSHKSICLHPQLYTVTDPHVIPNPSMLRGAVSPRDMGWFFLKEFYIWLAVLVTLVTFLAPLFSLLLETLLWGRPAAQLPLWEVPWTPVYGTGSGWGPRTQPPPLLGSFLTGEVPREP